MKHSFLFPVLLFLGAGVIHAKTDLSDKRLMPDTIVMNDGTEIHGLILRNDAQKVILQERMTEVEIPKSYIRRIRDEGNAGVYFADIIDPGKLPPWRMIVQDLRTSDNIRSLLQVPATSIDNGYLKNIPYLSFKVNKRIEMNVYGNPEDPVCLEFGVYAHGEKITEFKKIIRAYLAGILQSRAEIAALYGLDEMGGKKQVGKFTFEVTPPEASDAYGGWWISVYDAARLDRARLSDAAYRKVTLPFREVNRSNGELRHEQLMKHERFLTDTMLSLGGTVPDRMGFYRDRAGDLKLLTSGSLKLISPKAPKALPSPSPVPTSR
ncbi:MAG: hypothetical protein K8R38_05690 [Verrucomicrobia bacterium]|nr:hypothetical protein [Verrucomicrobiota bacterium]